MLCSLVRRYLCTELCLELYTVVLRQYKENHKQFLEINKEDVREEGDI